MFIIGIVISPLQFDRNVAPLHVLLKYGLFSSFNFNFRYFYFTHIYNKLLFLLTISPYYNFIKLHMLTSIYFNTF